MKITLFLLLFLPAVVFCQLSDDFSDGDFLTNPSWNGTVDNFMVNSSFQLQLNASIEGDSYLSAPYSSSGTTEWRFYIRLAFSPSGNNFAQVFLSTQSAELTASTDGYFLRFGEAGSNDAIELFKNVGGIASSICRGTTGLLATAFAMDVKVLRTPSGDWTIYTDPTASGNYSEEASGTDNTIQLGDFFGFYCRYTSSYANKMYFDDVYAGGQIVDIIPPHLSTLNVIDPFGLSLIFSEPTDITGLTNVLNYTVDGGIGHPHNAFIGENTTQVSLQFDNLFENGRTNTLSITGIKDLSGNSMDDTSVSFSYYEASANDILINEIMADPSPVIGLPEWEFVELFNTTPLKIDLTGWKFLIGETEKTILSAAIEPNSYLVLTDEEAVAAFSMIGSAIGFSSFQLTNAGATLKLMSDKNVVISNVTYSDGWYNDSNKKEGGWSLEQIDPTNACGGKNNWDASNDPTGGTPDRFNSVYATNNATPKPERFTLLTNNIIQLWFDQQMDDISVSNTMFYELSPGNIFPSSATLNEADPGFVQLVFDQAFTEGTIYTLRINPLVLNCTGIAVAPETQITFGIPNPVSSNDIIINEVLFNPLGDGVDYVEMYNNTNKIFDIEQLMLGNVSQTIPNPPDTTLKPISESSRLMLPETYLLLSVSSSAVLGQYESTNPENFVEMASFPSYSNDAGTVILKSKSGKLIDVFSYSDAMHFPLLTTTEGVSLERISFTAATSEASNWHSAAQTIGFGTPGYQNSMFDVPVISSGEITVEPEVFSPDSDGHNDVTAIGYHFDQAGFTFNAYIYNANGVQIKHLVKSNLIPKAGVFYWDGLDETGNKVSVGIYVLAVEVFNLEGKVNRYKKPVVVATK